MEGGGRRDEESGWPFVACCVQGATRRRDKLADLGDLVRGRLQGLLTEWRSELRNQSVKGVPRTLMPLEPLSNIMQAGA